MPTSARHYTNTEAALAWLDMARGNTHFALERARQIAQWLAENGTTGVELPLQVYWQCYTILHSAGTQAEATKLLQTAHTLLQQKATNIQNKRHRQRFLTNIPYHRQIINAYAQKLN